MCESLAFTKRKSQAFACLAISKQTNAMQIADIRRERLRAWFAEKSIPEREKSYISQLMTGKASFGEKAARRLESDYGMPILYLDQLSKPSAAQLIANYEVNAKTVLTKEESSLLSAYRKIGRPEQLLVLKMLDIKPDDFAKSA